MKSIFLALNLFALLLGSACQVKETNSSAGLISGHAPATNSFVLQQPSAFTYVTGETLSLTIRFPFPVTVTGVPQLSLTIGSTTRYADYASGNGSTLLTFTYPIVVADNDADGITINSLGLNGGTLTFDNKGVVTNCIPSTLGVSILANVKVDNAGPTLSGFELTNITGFYRLGQALNFTFTFNEPVYVTGTPKFTIGLSTGGTVDVNYASGSGSTALSFTYTITNTNADSDGYSINSPITGGTVKDVTGNAYSLDFSASTGTAVTQSATVDLDGRLPYIVSVTPPANATYIASQNLEFVANFNRPVSVAGAHYIEIDIGGTQRRAYYVSGTGTTAFLFRYTTVPGDEDLNGVTIKSFLLLDSGNITGTAAPTNGYYEVLLNTIFASPITTGVVVNAPLPRATSVVRNVDTTIPIFGGTIADNVWNIGQQLLITVGFNTNVTVNQTNGVPRIPITIGATTRYATYFSGGGGQSSLIFQYVIQEGDLDTDTNIALGNIDLNNGNITDSVNTNIVLALPVPQLTLTSVDGVRPVISSVTPPSNGTYSTVAGNNNANMTFRLNWSEAVNYSTTTSGSVYVPLNIGGTNNHAQYTSGNDTATIYHNPGALTGQVDTDGVTSSSPVAGLAVIRDRAGNEALVLTFTPPNTTAVRVDTVLPTVSSITPPANGTFIIGQNLDFAITFSESVTVLKSGGYPRIPVTIGSTVRYLEPVSNGTGLVHTFRYTVILSDLDTNGVAMGNTIQHSAGGYVRDIGQNLASVAYTPPTTTSVLVDGVRPVVSSAGVSVNRTYGVGENIDFTLTYSEAVNFTGAPRIAITVGSTTRYATYLSGTGTANIVFRYTVPSGDLDTDGIAAVATIDLNSGTINDLPGNPQTVFTFSSPALTGVRVDGVGPSILSITPPATDTYGVGEILQYAVNFNEVVTVGGTPQLQLQIGGDLVTATYVSGSGSTGLVFTYTVLSNQEDVNGVQATFPLLLNGGTIRDDSLNNAVLAFGNVVTAGVLVDGISPGVSGVISPTAGAYQAGGARPTISFTVNYNEVVIVSGVPRIQLAIGSNTRYANYVSGSGTGSLLFSYSVVAADLSLVSVTIGNASAIALNGGTIRDAELNNAGLSLTGATTARVTVVFPSLRNWYDLTDTATVGLSGGSVTSLNDRIGSLNLNSTGAVYSATGFNSGTSAYATCTVGAKFTSAAASAVGFIAVFRAPASNSGFLFNSSAQTLQLLNLNLVGFGTNGGHYSGAAFGSGSTLGTGFWTSSSGAAYARAVKWDSPTSQVLNICEMSGEIAEFFMFSTVPTASEMTRIEAYITSKHGLSFP